MTFTYNLTTPNNITRVRFAVVDTDPNAFIFSDEVITFRITESGDWKHAVIDCLNYIIGLLSAEGDFTADWLTVRQDVALKSYQMILQQKRQEFGISLSTSRSVYTYRPDNTNTTTAPTFDATADH